jgi:serine/threonine protein kinase
MLSVASPDCSSAALEWRGVVARAHAFWRRTAMPSEVVDVRPREISQSSVPGVPPTLASGATADSLAELSRSFVFARVPMPEIPGYEIQRELGRGGSATVYLARERKHDRMVAVKVLHPALAASLQAQRFLREIEITGRLAHPNILPLLDSGVAGVSLYYVTPFVPGESLRMRIQRERRLSVDEAVRIVREVAQGLDYAHRHGVVHRDVKPENILLADGHAVVADFGIARAVSAATDRHLTAGSIVGTPLYMSPEQVAGAATVDGRSDVYSLACVLYELISGTPPFADEDVQTLIRRHVSDPAPLLRHAVAGAPRGVEWALSVALSKAPSARFATVSEFAESLTNQATWRTTMKVAGHLVGRPIPRHFKRSALAIIVVSLATLILDRSELASVDLRLQLATMGIGEVKFDTTHYAVLPSDSSTLDLGASVRAGLGRWRDVIVENASRVSALARRDGGITSNDGARRVAMRLRAGRYVRTDAVRAGDSLVVTASIFDTRTNEQLKRAQMRIANDSATTRPAVEALVDSLVFRENAPRAHAAGNAGTGSLFARQAYLRGHAALANGDFAAADSEFFAAARRDPEFGQARVWLATVRSWTDRKTQSWAQLPSQAAAKRGSLTPQDSLHLEALTALAANDAGRACALWRQMTTQTPADYAAWYSLANCLHNDRAVLRSRRGEWHFRSSMQESVAAYQRAFRLQPSVLNAFSGRALTRLETALFTSGAFVRTGNAVAPDTLTFNGYPTWQGDSLAFVPRPATESRLALLSNAVAEAVDHQRERFRNVAAMWRAEFPESADAMEALALAMDMSGDPASLDTLRRARTLAKSPNDRLRMAVSEVWLRVKFALPSNATALRAARALADSILWAHPVDGNEAVASLASLTGRAERAAAYSRMDVGNDAPSAIARNGPALLAFAALGGPADSLRDLARTVDVGVQSMPLSSREATRRGWLMRAATLAFPDYRLEPLTAGAETGLRLGNLISAALAEDTTRVRRILDEISTARRWLRPADIRPDGLLPEASALARIGDVDGAIARLDPTLRSIRLTASQDLAFTSSAGPLVRAMVLRADLANRIGDAASARLWAAAVVELWSGADPFLQPTVQRMQQLAR